jgi:hypothetical protein
MGNKQHIELTPSLCQLLNDIQKFLNSQTATDCNNNSLDTWLVDDEITLNALEFLNSLLEEINWEQK